jgi:hypothetical protein
MTADNHQFRAESAIVAIILACTGAALLQSKLDFIAVTHHLAILHAGMRWWPLLLIMAGMILLLDHHSSGTRSREAAQQAPKTQPGETNEPR